MRPVWILILLTQVLITASAHAQTPPSPATIANYNGLHLAAHQGDLDRLNALIGAGANLEAKDAKGRTALHVAAFASHEAVVTLLGKAGADANAFEHQAYDIVTIAAVADDTDMLEAALAIGTSPGNITSPYDGTALIAAAHLGHHRIVKRLIKAGAPLDHINNLNWTALIEVVVLGDGGPDHIETLKALLAAGADKSIPDRNGQTPLDLAKAHGFTEMVALLED